MSISYLNSLTPRNVVSGFVFIGVYDDILSTSQITTRITANVNTDNHYTLLIEYSNDKFNVVSSETSTLIFDYNKLIYFTPTSRYFKLTLTAISNINDLSIETIFKHAIVYQAINQISGNVIVDNMPATQQISGNVAVTNFPTTQTILNGSIDLLNSSTNPLLIGESFVGTYVSSLLLSEINVSFEADGVFDLNIQYSLDGINLGVSKLHVVGELASPYLINLPPLTNYYRISLSNVVSNMTYLRLSTTPRNTISYKGNTISGDVSVNNFPTVQQTQEQPTTLAFHNNELSNVGVVLYNTPLVLRNLSITNTSAVISYVHIYNMNTIPTSSNASVFLVPIAPNVVSNIFNEINHHFTTGLAFRATTTYNGNTSATANSVYLNGSYNLLV